MAAYTGALWAAHKGDDSGSLRYLMACTDPSNALPKPLQVGRLAWLTRLYWAAERLPEAMTSARDWQRLAQTPAFLAAAARWQARLAFEMAENKEN